MLDLAITVGVFLVILTVLVFIHEMGHFWVARRVGVKVEAFSVGFGPELFGWTDSKGTRWKMSAIPLGGYVKMFGDMGVASTPDHSVDALPDEVRGQAFHHKTVWQRIAVVAAGPAANYLFAVLLAAVIYSTYGMPFTPPNVGEVIQDSPAMTAGLQPEDRVVSLDGSSIDRFEDIQRIVQIHPGATLPMVVERDGQRIELQITPERIEVEDTMGNPQPIGRIGITRSSVDSVRLDPVSALSAGVQNAIVMTGTIFDVLGQIVLGDRSSEEIGGVLRIAHMSGEVAQVGLAAVLNFAVLLSINLGLINLFPIPMLDGGHLLFYGVEAVRGRPLGQRAMEFGYRVGAAMVLALIVFATWNDLVYFRVVDMVKQLVS